MPEKKTRKPPKQGAFLLAYATLGNVTAAARVAKLPRSQHYLWLDDPLYKAAFDEAHEQACDALEEEVRRRALKGVLKPVFYKGKRCGGIREFSDTLLMFMLKRVRNEFRENYAVEHTGPSGGPLQIEVVFVKP
jgi:hypothetical protein